MEIDECIELQRVVFSFLMRSSQKVRGKLFRARDLAFSELPSYAQLLLARFKDGPVVKNHVNGVESLDNKVN